MSEPRISEGTFTVDLSNCDREPIHILGAIQPFGFLLALSNDWHVMRASANVTEFIGRPASALLGQSLSNVFTVDAIHNIRNRLMHLQGSDAVERLFGQSLFDDGVRLFDLVLHYVGGQLVIESEPAQPEQRNAAGTIRGMITRLDPAESMEQFFREGARQVRTLTGFDRVMVYRFDAEGAGEVVAEAAKSGIGSFLGLRYPASDIPAQARVLYLRNLFRIIADVSAAPVPIVPPRDEGGAPLDLSLAVSRAVSPIHIEYLSNMGVAASLSISIVVEGKLWGLFACHHYSPRLPSLERRSLAELFGQVFATKLESRERQVMADYLARARTVGDSLLSALASNASLLEEPGWLGETINRAIESDGMGVSINGRISLTGLAPSEAEFVEIVRALNGAASSRVYATSCITDFIPTATTELAAGMLAMPISRSPRDYVVLFRQEFVRSVRWAGDPHKPVEYGVNGPRLTPRKSFESWSQLVRGRSKPFTPTELKVAEMLRSTLIEVVLRLSEESHVERQLASERQEVLIAELNHRVRNILTLIRALVQRSRGNAVSVEDYVRETDSRINALARAHDQITNDRWGPAALRSLIQTEAEAYFAAKSSHIVLEGPEVLLVPLAFSTLALVIHELMTNSAKYGALSAEGHVNVQWRFGAERELLLSWHEHGGPPVKAPAHQGFGSTIIRRSIPYDLGGNAEVHYHPDGFHAEFSIPAHFVSERLASARNEAVANVSPMAKSAMSATLLEGCNVLVVEDSLVIALFAEDCLLQLGAEEVSTAATISQALAEIARQRPKLALLDVHLGDQTSFPIAERLRAAGVPFVFTTGYGERMSLPESLAGATVLQKPYTREGVASALAALLRPAP